jgi:hypothetical protein
MKKLSISFILIFTFVSISFAQSGKKSKLPLISTKNATTEAQKIQMEKAKAEQDAKIAKLPAETNFTVAEKPKK